ncbi:MAG TPA: hypothetical protein VLS49_13465 [Usitatibacter sp.]|nr:hypothetical protein [Usitatibacter sp.]
MTMTPAAQAEGAPGFADARGCKEWLNALPLTNIPQAQSLVLETVRALNAAAFAPLERLKCMELLRDKVAFLQGEQRSRYFGKSLPLSPNDSAAWTTGAALLAAMEEGYRRSLAEAASSELAPHRALIAQRVARSIGTLMLFHAIVYRRFDPEIWRRLHALYGEAEAAGFAEERVKDSLEGDQDGSSSVADAYVQVVLLQAAYLSEMTGAQIDFAEALLKQWLRKVRVMRAEEAPALELLPLVADLSSSIGARPLPRAELKPVHRAFDVDQVSRSLRKRIQALQSDEDPAKLGLPAQSAGLDLAAQLKRLHKLWCEGAPPRPPGKASELKIAGLVFTLPEVHFFASGGKLFEQPDKSRELTREEKQDIEVFGRVTERTQSRMLAEHNFSVEPWGVVEEMPGTWRLQRPPTASKGVAIGRLVGVRLGETGTFFLGVIRALVQETDGRIVATVALFPGKPEPIAVRAGDARNRSNAHWTQALRLPALERLQVPASLVVPASMAVRGRGIEVWEGAPKESTVYEVLEHGADFDRVSMF